MNRNELNALRDSLLAEIKQMMLTTGQVTQYIGARYVPVFANPIEWDEEREYEPLTVVMYQGDSYTSRQFVPKGIRIADAHYWALTGNYNAQIEKYREEVKKYTETVNEFDSRINDLGKALNDIKSITTVEEYGAKGDGITDDTQAFIDALSSGKAVVLDGSKEYKVSNLKINQDYSVLYGMNAKIIGTNGDDSVLHIDNTWNSIIRDINIDCSGASCGIKVTANNSNIDNVFIDNATIQGIIIGSGDGIKTSGYGNVIHRVIIHAIEKGCIGILYGRSDNVVDDVVTRDCQVGIKFTNGFCIVNNFHPWISKKDFIINSTAIEIATENHIHMTNLYLDTIETAFKVATYIPNASDYAFNADNVYLYYNSAFNDVDVKYAVVDCVNYQTAGFNLNNVSVQNNSNKQVKFYKNEPEISYANINFIQQQTKIPNELVKYNVSGCQFDIGEGVEEFNVLTKLKQWYDGKVQHFVGAFKTTKTFSAYGLNVGKLYRRDYKVNESIRMPCILEYNNKTVISSVDYSPTTYNLIVQNTEEIPVGTVVYLDITL